jgi:hypothetical protein
LKNQVIGWSEWQDLNLIQTIDIAQGGSDNRARRLGKTRSKPAEILTGRQCAHAVDKFLMGSTTLPR